MTLSGSQFTITDSFPDPFNSASPTGWRIYYTNVTERDNSSRHDPSRTWSA